MTRRIAYSRCLLYIDSHEWRTMTVTANWIKPTLFATHDSATIYASRPTDENYGHCRISHSPYREDLERVIGWDRGYSPIRVSRKRDNKDFSHDFPFPLFLFHAFPFSVPNFLARVSPSCKPREWSFDIYVPLGNVDSEFRCRGKSVKLWGGEGRGREGGRAVG